MIKMSDKELDLILDNDKEWRRYLLKKVDNVEEEMKDLSLLAHSLKIKVGLFSVMFGAFGAVAFELLKAYLSVKTGP